MVASDDEQGVFLASSAKVIRGSVGICGIVFQPFPLTITRIHV